MLIFIDESGDPGLKLKEGSSPFFTVGLVVFEDENEAIACDKRIELLKKELNWKSESEFHFKNNSDRVREVFFNTISSYDFFYYGIVMNKAQLWGEGFKDKKSFYKYSCSLVFENAKNKLDNAIIVFDKSGNTDFRRQLDRYLKARMGNSERKMIKKIKMQRSTSNNLLQLADYVAGAINRSMVGKCKNSEKYRRMISHREMYVQIWPKENS